MSIVNCHLTCSQVNTICQFYKIHIRYIIIIGTSVAFTPNKNLKNEIIEDNQPPLRRGKRVREANTIRCANGVHLSSVYSIFTVYSLKTCCIFHTEQYLTAFKMRIYIVTAQQTQNICITFIQCWTNVEDVGSMLFKYYTNVLCLLGASAISYSYYSKCRCMQ